MSVPAYPWLVLLALAFALSFGSVPASAITDSEPSSISKASSVFNRDKAVFFDLHTDDEVDQLLGFLLSNFPDFFLTYVNNPASLQEGGLSVRLTVSETGQVSFLPGKLFTNEPVILVVDYRTMTASQIAELNQLLDHQPAYNGEPLSSSVFIIAIADESGLSDQSGQDMLPGSDFWRRLDGLGAPLTMTWLSQQFDGCSKSLTEYLHHNVHDRSDPRVLSPYPRQVLDFGVDISPQDLLTGGLDINESGQVYARISPLTEPGEAIIYLRDAPWEQFSFKLRLANIMIRNSFEFNRLCQNLASDKMYVYIDSSSEAITRNLADYAQTPVANDGPWLRLNSANFDSVMNGLSLKSGILTRINPATYLATNFSGVEVTSSLNRRQWRRLTKILENQSQLVKESFGIRVIEQRQPINIPGALFSPQKQALSDGVELIYSQDERQTLETLRHQFPAAYIEWINPHTSGVFPFPLDELFEQIQLTSQKDRQYVVAETEFHTALKEGRTIILGGLSSNSEAQQLTENLLGTNPFLQRLGQFDFLDQLNLKVIWPENAKASSLVWEALVNDSHSVQVQDQDQNFSVSFQEELSISWDGQPSPEIRIAEALQAHSLFYFEGPAGSGKSYLADKVARSLNPDIAPIVLTTGPNTRLEDLAGEPHLRGKIRGISREEWVSDGFPEDLFARLKSSSGSLDNDELLVQASESLSWLLKLSLSDQERQRFEEKYIDFETVTSDGAVIKWAKTRSLNNRPVILILDEGNLLLPGLQQLFAGLLSSDPFISVNGHFYPLSEQHKLIIIGNPDSYGGRNITPLLSKEAYKIKFPRLDDQALKELVILPYLNALDPAVCSDNNCEWVADQALDIVSKYQQLLPSHPFSARGLLDGLSRMAYYLDHSLAHPASTLSLALWQSFSNSFAGELKSSEILKFKSIRQNYFSDQGLSDDAELLKQADFDTFFTDLANQETNLHLQNPSTKQFARQIWLELQRVKGELISDKKHSGRHGMLIQGPAGRGKDVILDRVEQLWRQQNQAAGVAVHEPMRINAGFNNWDALKSMIIKARVEGRLLMVSELNLIPTHYLEGALNDVLTGAAAPGFFLFATVNPPQYSGRNPLSDALTSRFTQVILDEYTQEDLTAIAVFYNSAPFAQTLAAWHFERVSSLRAQEAKAIPAVMKLIAFINSLNEVQEPVAESWLWNQFRDYYRLYLKDGWEPKTLRKNSVEPVQSLTEQETNQESDFITTGEALFIENTDNVTEKSQSKTASKTSRPITRGKKPSAIDGNILYDPNKFLGNIQKLFSGNIPASDYRSYISRLSVDKTMKVSLVSEPSANPRVILYGISSDVITKQNRRRYLGRESIKVNIPQPLTSLFTREKLVALRLPDFTPEQLLIEYDPFQGVHYLTVTTSNRVIEYVDVEFLTESNVIPLTPEFSDIKPVLSSLISTEVREQLDSFFGQHPEIYAELGITKEMSIHEKILKITGFTQNFRVENQEQPAMANTDSSLATLLELLVRQAGACRHRSYVAGLLGFYFDIPTRITSNAIHMWVEFSEDDGYNWTAYDLGGYPGHVSFRPANISGMEVDTPVTKIFSDAPNLVSETSAHSDEELHSDVVTDEADGTYKEEVYKEEYLPIFSKIFFGQSLSPEDKRDVLQSFYKHGWDGYFDKYASEINEVDPELETMNFLASEMMQAGTVNNYLTYLLGRLLREGKITPDQLGNTNFLLWQHPENQPFQRLWMKRLYRNVGVTTLFTPNKKHQERNRQFAGSELAKTPIAGLSKGLVAKESGFRIKWSHQPGGKIDINRLLERKPAFYLTQEKVEESPRKVVFAISVASFIDTNGPNDYTNATDGLLDGVSPEDREQIHEKIIGLFLERIYDITGVEQGRVTFLANPGPFITDGYAVSQFHMMVADAGMSNKLQWFYSTMHDIYDNAVINIYNYANSQWLPAPWKNALMINDRKLFGYFQEFLNSLTDEQINTLKQISPDARK